jgi:hypothetical protein
MTFNDWTLMVRVLDQAINDCDSRGEGAERRVKILLAARKLAEKEVIQWLKLDCSDD